jgi:hypothetical protein
MSAQGSARIRASSRGWFALIARVVPAAGVQVVRVAAVGVQGIGGDQHVVDVELVEQGGERGDLAALLLDLDLAEDGAGGLVENRHQMRQVDAAVGGTDVGAAQGLAVQGVHAALFATRCLLRRWLGIELGQHPGPQRGLQRRGPTFCRMRRRVDSCGTTAPTPSAPSTAWPASWAYSATAANDRAPDSTAHARAAAPRARHRAPPAHCPGREPATSLPPATTPQPEPTRL